MALLSGNLVQFATNFVAVELGQQKFDTGLRLQTCSQINTLQEFFLVANKEAIRVYSKGKERYLVRPQQDKPALHLPARQQNMFLLLVAILWRPRT